MEDNIIELAETERTLEQNFASIGAEYFNEMNKTRKQSLPIYGSIYEDTGILVLVASEAISHKLIELVNHLNNEEANNVHGNIKI